MDPNLNPQAVIAYLLDHVATMLAHETDQVLQEQFGIGVSQFKILTVLQQNPSIPQRKLADHLGQTEASVSRQIKLMQSKGLLVQRVDQANRRVHITELTAKGASLTDAARAAALHAGQPILGKLHEKQQKQLIETLRVLHDGICPPGKPTACDHPFDL